MLAGWVRSAQAGPAPGAALAVPVVATADLARRHEQSAAARTLAQAGLKTLAQQIAGSNVRLACADADGAILDLYAGIRADSI